MVLSVEVCSWYFCGDGVVAVSWCALICGGSAVLVNVLIVCLWYELVVVLIVNWVI